MKRNILLLEITKTWTCIVLGTTLITMIPAIQGVPVLQLTVEPEDTIVVPGMDAVLNCVAESVEGVGTPVIKWRRGDGEILNFIGDRYRSPLSNGSLYFTKVLPSQQDIEGEYQCVVELHGVGSIVSRTARLTIAAPPQLALEPQDLTIFPGQTAYFSCLVDSVLPFHISWLKDMQPLIMDETRMLVLPSGALEIDEVRASDMGRYSCNVSSNIGHSFMSRPASLSINLDTEAGADIMSPEFVATPRSLTVSEGSTVTLDCAANGNPRPYILWLKDGITLDMKHLDGPFRKVGTGSLQIINIEESDSGVYQCRADNRDDSVDATSSVVVQIPPRFLKRPSDHQIGYINADAELECKVYGKPEPKVFWMKNGDRIEPNDYIQVVNGNSLRILGLVSQDSGIFQCIASNPAGNIQSSSRLVVLESEMSTGRLPSSSQGVPSAPQDLKAVYVSTRFITLTWKPPVVMHGKILNYTVFYRQEGSQRERVVNTTTPNLEETVISGLSPDRKYHIRVQAYSLEGPGESSEILTVTTLPEVHVPGPATGLKATAVSPTSVLVQWSEPEQSNGPIQRYKVYYMEGDSAEEHHIVTSEHHYRLTDLKKFTDYSIWVVAFNQNGPGTSTEEIVVRTLSDVPSEPPQNITLEASSSSSIIVRWEPPPEFGRNGVITGYKIRYRKADVRRGDTVSTDANRRMYTLTNLDRSSRYQVRVLAQTVNGTGPASEWNVIETFENDLDETRVPDPPVGLKTRAMADSITVQWSPPRNQKILVRGYTIGWGKGIPDAYTQVLDNGQLFYVIEKLEPNSEYVISLRAYNEIGDGRPVYSSVRTKEEQVPEPLTPLLPPVGLQALVLSSATVVLSWTDSTLSKSQYVTDNRYYVVRYTSSHYSANPRYKYLNSTDMNCMIDNLKPNTQYEFTVKVIKGRRESPWSMVVLNMTQEAAPSTAPRDLTVVPMDNNPSAVSLNWQPPKQPNGAITGYVILYTTDLNQRDRDWIVEGIVGDKMTTTVMKLKPDTTYYFKIQARNGKGYGPFSSTISFYTPPGNGVVFEGQPVKGDGHAFSNSLVMYVCIGCGVVIVIAIVTGIAIVCCRNKSGEHAKKGYMKGSMKGKNGKNNIKPPDLWIHHDQMELKASEKMQPGANPSCQSTSVDGSSGMPIAVTTLPRTSQDYDGDHEKFHHPGGSNSLDKRTYVSSYIGGGDEKSSTARRVIKAKPIMLSVDNQQRKEPIATATPISGPGPHSSGLERPIYPRTQYSISRAHVTLDQSIPAENPYSIQGAYDTVTNLPASGGGAPGPPQNIYTSGTGSSQTDTNSSITSAKRLQGHPLKSFSVPAPPPQSAPGTPQPKHVVRPQVVSASPYKKAGLLASVQSTSGTPTSKSKCASTSTSTSEEASKLQPSYSTEELNQEMANLEGLMKDLNAITASEFEI